jgi:NAD(P)-dependent dehydrogenase (short-subunit alcohol dehydrogenase family)
MEVMKLDITSASDRAQILEQPLDVLLNNAGVGESGSLAEVDVDRIRQAFEVNVFATLELTQLALRGMIARRSGTVLFVSSIAGRIPMPFLMPYAMTKFALVCRRRRPACRARPAALQCACRTDRAGCDPHRLQPGDDATQIRLDGRDLVLSCAGGADAGA